MLFLLYHYFNAKEYYNAIRVFIAGYVWLTGFGECGAAEGLVAAANAQRRPPSIAKPHCCWNTRPSACMFMRCAALWCHRACRQLQLLLPHR